MITKGSRSKPKHIEKKLAVLSNHMDDLIDEYGVADLLGIMVERLTDRGVTRQADILSVAIDRLLWREKNPEDENVDEYYKRNARPKETE